MKSFIRYFLAASLVLSCGVPSFAGEGTEGASFLNTPVGAEPAAMAGAYSAMAVDAYAPVWNPGALGRVETAQLTTQYLTSLETIRDTHMGLVYPFGKNQSLGVSFRYLGSGDINQTDQTGNAQGIFTSHYGSYAVAYGRALNDKLSLGVTGKLIDARIANVGASAYAVDLGSYYQATQKLSLAGVVTNLGTQLTFIEHHDPLPLAFHLGGAYRATPDATVSVEGVYRQTGLASLHAGVEWKPVSQIALRVGYRTDTLKGLSPLAGLTTGISVNVLGQALSYAWLPLGDLGNTQYVSLLIRFNNLSPKK